MGHSKAQKAATHDRLVSIAGRRFRERGLEGLSVADLMKEAGLTVGGFYKHFDSREALVREALGSAMAESEARVGKRRSLAEGIDAYLSPEHRDDPGAGCAFAALSSDAGRATAETRALFTERIEQRLRSLAKSTAAPDGMTDRDGAIVALSTLVGALSLARAVSDDRLSEEILKTARMFLREAFAGDQVDQT
jgi:TetR/AcrR family transcriptional regulator, transcriptional repressor for nem operon